MSQWGKIKFPSCSFIGTMERSLTDSPAIMSGLEHSHTYCSGQKTRASDEDKIVGSVVLALRESKGAAAPTTFCWPATAALIASTPYV